MGSIADSILKGTYGKNSSSKSSVADMIIDGSYSERVRKQREEEEEKRRAERERQKKVSEAKTTTSVLPKANNNFSSLEDLQKEYDKLSLTEQAEIAKQINNKTGLEKIALSSNNFNNTPLVNLDETKLKTEKDLKLDNLKTDAKAIGSNLLNSAKVGGTQLFKSMAMNVDKTQNMYIDAGNKMNEMIIKEMEKEGKDTSHLKQAYREKYNSKPFYQEKIDKLNQKMAENTEKTTNPTSKKIAEISQGLGNNIVGAVATAINPTAGLVYFTGSAKGSYYDEAIQRGMSEEEAENYSGVMALMEGVTEKYLAGENIKGFKNILKGQGFKNAVKSFGIEVGENFVQEAVMPSISEVTALATAGKEYLNYDFTTAEGWENLLSDSWSDGIDGALSSIMLNGATKGVASATRVVNKMKNGQTVTQKEIATAVEDSQKAGVDVEEILHEKIVKSAKEKITQNNQELQNNIDTNIENTQGQINSELNEILNNKELPMQGYKYESSNNAKINNLRQQAGQYFNNSQEAHKFVDMLEKIIVDKDIEIRLDANLKTADGRVANGSYSNGVITINPNSARTGEFIAIHELTHAIGTKSMMNIVENYRKNNAEFNSAVESLLQNYNATELTEEALSDVSAQLFGNQEFINNIANTNPGFFKKIYNEIKYLWHQFRGYKNQNQFVEDLYYKWTQAYNSNNKLNGTNKYSVAGKNARTANIKNLSEAVKLEEQGKSAQEIYEKTGWYRGNESKWRFEIDDNDFNIPSDSKIETNRLYELHEILDADKLYDAYPDLYNTEVAFMDLGEKGGYYDIKDDVIYLNNNLIKNTDAKSYEMLGLHNQSQLFSVLNHEIQHWIQGYEEFSNGSNTEYWEEINKNKRKEAEKIEQDLTYYQDKIGYKKYHEKQLDKMLNKEITGEEYERNIQEFINNSEYAEEINKLKEMYDKTYPYRYVDELYRNTAGEQEARNVQERIKLSSEEKKNILPFVKDKFTVYAKDGTKSYSIAGINAVNNIKNNRNLYDQAISNYNLAKDMAGKGKNNLEIIEKTGWFKDKNGDWKFEFSDKHMSLKNMQYEVGKIYELGDILNHNELFMFYPKLSKHKVEFVEEKNSKKKAKYDNESETISINSQLLNKKNAQELIEGTLIHEIQHAIQHIEGFEEGASSFSKLAYYNSLGEIEADNTKTRFIDEKYKNKNISNIAPESSKDNPKHRGLNNYLQNQTMLDKIKDGIYNYIKSNKGEYDYEINQEITSQDKEENNSKMDVGRRIDEQEDSEKSSFSMDNQGRILTKEQQEYFKDSKARDNKGNLLELYHGTPYEFNQFNYSKLGENTSSLGAGFYFTDNYKTAEEYKRNNGNLKRVYLDIKKPLKYGETTITKSEYKKFIEAINKETNGMFLEDYDGIENALMEYDYGGDDIDLVSAVQSASGLTHEKTFEILRDTIGYDGIISDKGFLNKDETLYVVFNANQIKNVNNTNPTSNPDIRYSQNNEIWQQHLDKNFKPTRTRTNMKDIGINVAPTAKNNVAPSIGNVEYRQKKTMDPTEISNLKLDDASTTPKLPQRKYKEGNKQSSFLSNIITDSKFLNEDLRQQMGKEDNIRYYQGITNEKTLENAYNKLQKEGQSEVIKWHSKDSKNANAEDVAEGWILLKQYQDSGDYQSAVEVAKKMRDIGTTAGQTVQAYNILSRLTPEGMFYYAQSELNEAYNKMVEGKSKKWIEENQSKFDLTPEETQSILDIMKDVSTMEEGYDKKVKLAEVQKIITNKIPPTAGQSIKAWMRISMLFNPKTQVRNVLGNAVIVPVNWFGDSVSAGIDKLIAKKTGVRTTGNTNLKNYGKGFGKGLYESYNDFKKGINTRNIEGNRFEVSEGKNFKDKGIGKAVNRVDNLLSFMLDAGDRGFYEATFVNSLNNQMVLNNVSTPTAEMIEIATNEALQRTWQDNNKYTQSVLKIRNILNNVNVKGYGLGDVIIPFAKTPANLTKAIVDYSPAGLVKTLAIDARKLKNSLENGQFTAKTQHQFVQNLGKATAGTFLYVLSYALAKAGIATGEADEDKDVKNFMKNSLGISSYSIKIGDKSFTYDWAQPIAAPLSIMTNIVNSKDKGQALLEGIVGNLDTAGGILLEQSFLESFNEVLNDNDGFVSGLINQTLELPARAVPTFSKQITDMVDGTQRTTFEYGKPIKSAFNSIFAKMPGASKTLPASIDTLGNEIQKYGGNNNIFNVMFNPANTNKGKLSKAGEEIYNVYNQTGDKTIFPRTAPYYINSKGEKKTMDAHQRSDFQTISGKYVENSLSSLLKDKDYKKLSNDEKANIINEIVSDSYSKAKYDVLKIDSKEYEKLRTILKDVKPSTYYNYKFKTENMKKDRDKIGVLADSNYTNKEKTALYENYVGKDDNVYKLLKSTNISITEYLEYKTQEFSADYKDNGTLKGESISGSKKAKEWNYIDNMNISYTQKLLLLGYYSEYTLNDSQQKHVINYIKSLPNKNNEEKSEILSHFKGITIYKNGTVEY